MTRLTKTQQNNVQRLISALANEGYTKTYGRLKFRQGYCCLGVAMLIKDVAIKVYPRWPSMSIGTYPPRGFMLDHYGIEKSQENHLSDLNDTSDTWEPVIQWLQSHLDSGSK